MKFLLAKKVEMTQKYVDEIAVPVTILHAGPCPITQVKTTEKDGYASVQLGFGNKRHLAKPQKGHVKENGSPRWLREVRLDTVPEEWIVGTKLTVDQFVEGDNVTVTATSKGRGFQGVVKRHGFHGSPASHGHKDQLRMPGSIGSTGPARVFKGTRMAGQMGNVRVTVKNLPVIHVDAEKNEIWVKGAVPGHRNSLVLIKSVGK